MVYKRQLFCCIITCSKVIKSHHHGKSKPIVVHCSDGCGRTGSYCLVDLVLNRIAKGTVKEVDVGATVEHLRDQRIGMVKTKVRRHDVKNAIFTCNMQMYTYSRQLYIHSEVYTNVHL